MKVNKVRPRSYFAPSVESLEYRIVLDADLDAAYARGIASLVQGGLYNWQSSPPWAEVLSWGNDWNSLKPSVGPDRSDSGSCEVNGVSYNWTVIAQTSDVSSGSPYGDSSGRTDWSEDISVTYTSTLDGSGGDSSSQTTVHNSNSLTVNWHGKGDTGWSAFSFDKIESDSYSTVITGGANSSDRSQNSGSTNYHYSASGGTNAGTPYGEYKLQGEVDSTTGMTDVGGAGTFHHHMTALEHIKYKVNDGGSLAPYGSSSFDQTNSGDSSFTGLVWGTGPGGSDEGSADPSSIDTSIGNDNVRLTLG